MLHDILSESSIFQEILREGMEKGLAEGRLQELRNSIISFVQACYPGLEELANKPVASCQDIELLDRLRMDLYMARSAKKTKQYLLALQKDRSGEA
jgi:predicted transposase YdaD